MDAMSDRARVLTIPIVVALFVGGCGTNAQIPLRPSPEPNTAKSTNFQCPGILPSVPGSLRLSGRIVLRDYHGSGPLFAFDPSNGQTTDILSSSGPHTIAAVSPDGQLLAYRDNNTTAQGDVLVIVDSRFVMRKAIPRQDSWLTIVNWINNEQLTILNADPQATMVILDMVTGQETPILFDQFPDFASHEVSHPWVEFDPTLQRVLYPIIGSKYSLFDLTSKKRIATLPAWTDEVPDASWALDGRFVAVSGPSPNHQDDVSDEIYVISREGEIEQITHLVDYYRRNVWVSSPRWSPDGKQLAFWLEHEANGKMDNVLAIVDTITKTVTNLCISSDPNGYGGEFDESLPAPIWSPDGKQIIVESRFSKDHNRVILVDLPNKIAVEIAQDARPVGWMATQP